MVGVWKLEKTPIWAVSAHFIWTSDETDAESAATSTSSWVICLRVLSERVKNGHKFSLSLPSAQRVDNVEKGLVVILLQPVTVK